MQVHTMYLLFLSNFSQNWSVLMKVCWNPQAVQQFSWCIFGTRKWQLRYPCLNRYSTDVSWSCWFFLYWMSWTLPQQQNYLITSEGFIFLYSFSILLEVKIFLYVSVLITFVRYVKIFSCFSIQIQSFICVLGVKPSEESYAQEWWTLVHYYAQIMPVL